MFKALRIMLPFALSLNFSAIALGYETPKAPSLNDYFQKTHYKPEVNQQATLFPTKETIEKVLEEMAEYTTQEFKIDLDPTVLRLNKNLPQADFSIKNLQVNDLGNRFKAEMAFNDDYNTTISITGKLIALVDVPVLTKNLQSGEVIEQKDLGWKKMPIHLVNRTMAASHDEVVGNLVKVSSLQADNPIKLQQLTKNNVIKKGAMVTITVQTPHMLLQTKGKALEDGTTGSVIRVSNLDSNQVIKTTVTGINQVAVDVPSLQ